MLRFSAEFERIWYLWAAFYHSRRRKNASFFRDTHRGKHAALTRNPTSIAPELIFAAVFCSLLRERNPLGLTDDTEIHGSASDLIHERLSWRIKRFSGIQISTFSWWHKCGIQYRAVLLVVTVSPTLQIFVIRSREGAAHDERRIWWIYSSVWDRHRTVQGLFQRSLSTCRWCEIDITSFSQG